MINYVVINNLMLKLSNIQNIIRDNIRLKLLYTSLTKILSEKKSKFFIH